MEQATESQILKESSIQDVRLEEASFRRATPDVEHERRIALFDLLEKNQCILPNKPQGPYALSIGLDGTQIILNIHEKAFEGTCLMTVMLALSPFRRHARDYFQICDSYYQAIRTLAPHLIEPIDMARRAIHDEAAKALQERLHGKMDVDFETARRLFTLIAVLFWKGLQRI